MAKIKIQCKACKQEVEREEKPTPKNKIEENQIYFNCPCGATNTRGGLAYFAPKKAKKKKQNPVKEPEKPVIQEPVKPVEEPERSIENEESEGPLIIQ